MIDASNDVNPAESDAREIDAGLYLIVCWLYNTAPFRHPGRPHTQEKWRLNRGSDKAKARRERSAEDRKRGLLILSYCMMVGIMTEDESQMVVDYAWASLPAIGHYAGMHEMIAAARRTLAMVKERQQHPRAGWDVEGTGGRRKPRMRVRDIIL